MKKFKKMMAVVLSFATLMAVAVPSVSAYAPTEDEIMISNTAKRMIDEATTKQRTVDVSVAQVAEDLTALMTLGTELDRLSIHNASNPLDIQYAIDVGNENTEYLRVDTDMAGTINVESTHDTHTSVLSVKSDGTMFLNGAPVTITSSTNLETRGGFYVEVSDVIPHGVDADYTNRTQVHDAYNLVTEVSVADESIFTLKTILLYGLGLFNSGASLAGSFVDRIYSQASRIKELAKMYAPTATSFAFDMYRSSHKDNLLTYHYKYEARYYIRQANGDTVRDNEYTYFYESLTPK